MTPYYEDDLVTLYCGDSMVRLLRPDRPAVWDKEWIGPGGVQGLRPSYEMVALLAQPDFAVPDRGVREQRWRSCRCELVLDPFVGKPRSAGAISPSPACRSRRSTWPHEDDAPLDRGLAVTLLVEESDERRPARSSSESDVR